MNTILCPSEKNVGAANGVVFIKNDRWILWLPSSFDKKRVLYICLI